MELLKLPRGFLSVALQVTMGASLPFKDYCVLEDLTWT